MSGEERAITESPGPTTVSSLTRDLSALDLPHGTAVLVHSSLSALGWVVGGAHAVVTALVDTLANDGTLVMPTHSGGLSDPSRWVNPPVPASWHDVIRNEMPAFDPVLTPTRSMGAIVECFRHFPGVRRSGHPTVSFAALGPRSDEIIGSHALENGLGERSPLARLYDADGSVLLIGVGFDRCTALHLAEFRSDYCGKDWITHGSPMLVDGERRWVTYGDLDGDTDDFEELGLDFVATGHVQRQPVGSGTMTLMGVRPLVDFAVHWFELNRGRR